MARNRDDEAFGEEAFLDDPETAHPDDGITEEEIPEELVQSDEIEALRLEVSELKDRLLRAMAETENIRKRAERDRRDAEIYGGTRLARDLLSVYDNFGRALENATEDVRAAAPGLLEGIELTRRDLVSAFEKHRIHELRPEIGDRFDPKLHQAMFEAPAPDTRAGDIIQVMNSGFTIGDRLLRPAQVGVSSGG